MHTREPPSALAALCRACLLRRLNHGIIRILPYCDLHAAHDGIAAPATSGGSTCQQSCNGASMWQQGHLGPLLSCLRRSIFLATKETLLRHCIDATVSPAGKTDDDYDYPDALLHVSLNRPRAAVGASSSCDVTRLQTSLFGQLREQLQPLGAERLRMGYSHPMDDGQARTFKVRFEGEGVDDYGGPYRETFTQLAEELTATSAPFTPPPATHESQEASSLCVLPLLCQVRACEGDATFAVAEGATEARHLSALHFLGQMLGLASVAEWRLHGLCAVHCGKCLLASHFTMEMLQLSTKH
ncbi:hypothetical protein JKP88DRAFT_256134 [Tribonema minus]|uniref:HECT domain-containing protein n=1 Tax=Tribonema minus TaxID=303371 RepID=A0A835YSZ9_9STRA|nr:hypothetical protein JKP88DRAFT_256134 [Tribonema minus]